MSHLFFEAFRHFAFPEDLAQRRLYQKVKEEEEKKDKEATRTTIQHAQEDAKRVYRV